MAVEPLIFELSKPGRRGVSVPDVDVHEVAGLQPLVIRNPVADHVIDRRANRLRKTTVVEVRGNRALHFHDVVVAKLVQLFRGHSGDDMLLDHVEHFGGQAAGDAHLFLFFGSLDRNVHSGFGESPAICVRRCSDEVFMV